MTDSEALESWGRYSPASRCDYCGSYDNWWAEYVEEKVGDFWIGGEVLVCGVCGQRVPEPKQWHLHFEYRDKVVF